MPHLIVPRRFNGPPHSGNGGWTSGALAATLAGEGLGRTIAVRLRLPPPLDTPMPLTQAADTAGEHHVLSFDGREVAEALISEADLRPTPFVGILEAANAEDRYLGHRAHPFPGCFVCGPARRPGDGLRIFPGAAVSDTGAGVVAATWTPFESSTAMTWAALDCPGGWSGDLLDNPVVLGSMSTRIDRLPNTRERYVLVGEQRGVEGRKVFSAVTLFSDDGEVLATAEQVWIAIDPAAFL